ncbi:hypothetical protein [Clostridium sp. OS1-26]|uniref:hypothetical protein n=1 Tax=Clostridium sp. OS1-26 TaxID=3070681 RepID=UPI0027E02077|nr:hypothetical protein [Clostridium sp. OS1-26]WML33220.1 hypothetical protein RCG18_17940 [Clostridium sp. OS1-26]
MILIKKETMSDIERCQQVLEKKDIGEAKKLLEILLGAYSDYIPGIRNNLDFYSYHYSSPVDYLGDIEKMKRKLELFLGNGCVVNNGQANGNIQINNTNDNNNANTNTNTNTNTIDLNVLFDETRQKIENDETLGEEEIKEILERIDEIKVVHESGEPRNRKWFRLRELMSWVGTKGLVVGTSILNLITAILKAQ